MRDCCTIVTCHAERLRPERGPEYGRTPGCPSLFVCLFVPIPAASYTKTKGVSTSRQSIATEQHPERTRNRSETQSALTPPGRRRAWMVCSIQVFQDTRGTTVEALAMPNTKITPALMLSYPTLQIGYLDSVVEGVQVSRQEMGGGQYRWTITFLDEGDDFELAAPVTTLATASGSTGITITPTKVRLGLATQVGRT